LLAFLIFCTTATPPPGTPALLLSCVSTFPQLLIWRGRHGAQDGSASIYIYNINHDASLSQRTRRPEFLPPSQSAPNLALRKMDLASLADEFDDRARVSNTSASGTKAAKPARNKFAVPPVKVACLEW
jgi:hypothetical protein